MTNQIQLRQKNAGSLQCTCTNTLRRREGGEWREEEKNNDIHLFRVPVLTEILSLLLMNNAPL